MSVLRTRTLMRPAAHHLSLSLVEHPTFQFRTFGAYVASTPGYGSDETALPSTLSRLNNPWATPSAAAWNPGGRTPFSAMSAMSSCSVYSQDSWVGPYTNSPEVLGAPNPIRHHGSHGLHADTRRFAIALQSPRDIDTLLPLAHSPLSASVGAFLIRLRRIEGRPSPSPGLESDLTLTCNVENEALNILTLSFRTRIERAEESFTTSPPSIREALPDRITSSETTPTAITSDVSNLPQTGVAKMAPHDPSGRAAKGLSKLLSRLSLPTPSSGTMKVAADAASCKRPKALRKSLPLTPSYRKRFSKPRKSWATVLHEYPIPSLPTIPISPLAINFGESMDRIPEGGSCIIPNDDWETIGVAI